MKGKGHWCTLCTEGKRNEGHNNSQNRKLDLACNKVYKYKKIKKLWARQLIRLYLFIKIYIFNAK